MTLIDELVAKHGFAKVNDKLYPREADAALRSLAEELLERCAAICDGWEVVAGIEGDSEQQFAAYQLSKSIRSLNVAAREE